MDVHIHTYVGMIYGCIQRQLRDKYVHDASIYENVFRFSAFADLFSEAVRRGLKGLKTQNAGLYYHQAALWAIQRKKVSKEMSIDLHNIQLLPALPQVNYYGQRPWRKNLTGIRTSYVVSI